MEILSSYMLLLDPWKFGSYIKCQGSNSLFVEDVTPSWIE